MRNEVVIGDAVQFWRPDSQLLSFGAFLAKAELVHVPKGTNVVMDEG